MKDILERAIAKVDKKKIFISITSGVAGACLYNQMQKSKKTKVDERIEMFDKNSKKTKVDERIEMFDKNSNCKYTICVKDKTVKLYEVRDLISEIIHTKNIDPNIEIVGITLYTNEAIVEDED